MPSSDQRQADALERIAAADEKIAAAVEKLVAWHIGPMTVSIVDAEGSKWAWPDTMIAGAATAATAQPAKVGVMEPVRGKDLPALPVETARMLKEGGLTDAEVSELAPGAKNAAHE